MTQLPERDLPPGRHLLLKEHLMTETRRTPATAPSRKRLRPVLLAGAVAAAAAVTVALPPTPDDPFVPPVANASPGVVQLLEDAALAAEHSELRVDGDQFTYVRSKSAYGITSHACTPVTAGPLQTRELWKSVDGASEGLLISTELGRLPIEGDSDPEPTDQNYDNLRKLPTDPDKMLAWLYKHKEGEGRPDADLAFDLAVQLLIESVMPPKTSAALYRAMAKIPGVVLVNDSVDAVGRHGTAVGFVHSDAHGASRQEMIFDPKTWKLLGERDVVLKDSRTNPGEVCDGIIKAGSVQATSAILERAIVDKPGQRP
ncbi:CU044_5270 family protein [Streptomyces sp. NPDC004539]|uniref:CU044_5270 family protein n=1 Tax=Streptomyces sp. NPDC004539 TaxID=3154280 RepID=UPI0033AC5EC2